MSTGPIEFIREPSQDTKGPTEYGGVAGLVQPETAAGLPAHGVTASEARGMIVRAEGAVTLVEKEIPGTNGVPQRVVVAQVSDGVATDPVTGELVDLGKLGVVEVVGKVAAVVSPPPTETP